MVAPPADTPTMAPLAALMVAIAGLDEVQVPPETEELKVVPGILAVRLMVMLSPVQIEYKLGFSICGDGFTVIVFVAVAFGQPPEPRTVYVMVAVPADTPTMAPLAALIVATAGFEEVQVPPETVLPKVTESPIQMD